MDKIILNQLFNEMIRAGQQNYGHVQGLMTYHCHVDIKKHPKHKNFKNIWFFLIFILKLFKKLPSNSWETGNEQNQKGVKIGKSKAEMGDAQQKGTTRKKHNPKIKIKFIFFHLLENKKFNPF